MANRRKELVFEDARIMYKNFSGEASKFNPNGNRTFCVILDEQQAVELENQGWNVKRTKAKPEYDLESIPYIEVQARFDNYPPKVVMVVNNTNIKLDEETISELDQENFDRIDLIISGSSWEMNGRKGIKAYLRTGYFTVELDPFFSRYNGGSVADEDLPF